MYKIDLHTHSEASPDGGISADQYAQALESELLDYIAITDHDRIDFAAGLHKALGDKIIVGQEVTTNQGEIIGLFLTEPIKPGMSAKSTALAIKKQGGLVYIPHPFETVRKGIQIAALDTIADYVDIIEVNNGRALVQNYGVKAAAWAKIHGKKGASSSDAHGYRGLGHSYSAAMHPPTAHTLVHNLKMTSLATRRAPLVTLLYPKMNRFIKKIGLKA